MASSAIPSPPESPLSSVDLKLLDGTQSSDQDVQRGHALIAPSKHLNTTQIDTVSHDQLVDLTTSIEAKAGAETLSNAPRDGPVAAPLDTQLGNSVAEHLETQLKKADNSFCKARTEFLFDPLVAEHEELLELIMLNRQPSLTGLYIFRVRATEVIRR